FGASGGGALNLTGTYNVTGGTTSSGGTTNFSGTGTNVGPGSVPGGAMTFTTPLAHNPGGVSITGGTLGCFTGQPITIPTLSLSNGIWAGTDTLTITGMFTWGDGGSLCTVAACNAAGSAVTNANGGITVTTGGFRQLYGRTLNNTGTAAFGAGGPRLTLFY